MIGFAQLLFMLVSGFGIGQRSPPLALMAGFVAAAGVGSRLLLLSSVSGYAIAHTLAGAPEDTTGSAVGSNSTAPTPTGSGLRVGSSAPGQPVLASACAVPTKQAPHAEDRPSAPGPGPAASRSGEEAARSSGSTSSPTPPSGPPAAPPSPSPSPPPSAAQPESPKHHPARGKPAPAPSADAPALSSVEPETDDLTTADAAAPSAEAAPPVSEPTSSPAPASGTGSNAVLVVSRPDGALSVLPRLDGIDAVVRFSLIPSSSHPHSLPRRSRPSLALPRGLADSEKWEPCGHIHGILGLFDCSSGRLGAGGALHSSCPHSPLLSPTSSRLVLPPAQAHTSSLLSSAQA